MIRNIRYYANNHTMELSEVPYSDEEFLKIIGEMRQSILPAVANEIHLMFVDENERYCSLFVTIAYYKDRFCEMQNTRTVLVYQVDLEKEELKDYRAEWYRIKRLLKKHFPDMRVSSDFRGAF